MTTPQERRSLLATTGVPAAAFAVLALTLWFGGGRPRPAIPGLPSPGTLTTMGLPLVRLVHDVCAVATVGVLLAAVVLARESDSPRAIARAAGPWALGWAASAALTLVLTLSDFLGLPVGNALRSGVLPTFLFYIPQGQAFLLVTVVALTVAAGAFLSPGRAESALLLALAVFAVLPPAYVGHSATAADHNLAVSSLMAHIAGVTVWVGGLFGLVTFLRHSAGLAAAVRRFSALALCCYVAVGVSGTLNAWVRLGDVTLLWQSRYGVLVLAKAAALAALGWFGWRHRRATMATLDALTSATPPLTSATPPAAAGVDDAAPPVVTDVDDATPPAVTDVKASAARGPFLRLAAGEIAVMAATIGLAVGLSRTAPPEAAGAAEHQHDALGYVLPAFSPGRLAAEIRPDPIALLAVAGLAVAYLVGVRRLAGRGEAWPAGRTASWLAGLLVLAYGLAGGVAAYGPAVFSIHAVQYALLGAVGPALLVLGAPLRLHQRADPAAARWTEGPVVRALTRPGVALALYAVPYLALYLTGLFEMAQTSLAVRLCLQAVVVLTAVIFLEVTAGTGSPSRGIRPPVRVLLLAGAVAVQAWIALLLLAGPLQGPGWYASLALPWAPERAADQRLGALLGLVPVVAAFTVLLLAGRRGARRLPASGGLPTPPSAEPSAEPSTRQPATEPTEPSAEPSAGQPAPPPSGPSSP